MDAISEHLPDPTQGVDSDNDQRVYFVPMRWWNEAQDLTSGETEKERGVLYATTPGTSYAGPMKLINNMFNSDIVFNLSREADSLQNSEVGVSGRDYALVPGELWVQALKWHSDVKISNKTGKGFSAAEDDMADVYPLQLRLSVLWDTNSLGVKISKKDNTVELFKRACKIFTVESEQLRIWDFSGQTTLLFMNDRNKFPNDCQRQSDQEILLELQVYGLSDSMKCIEGKKDVTSTQQCDGTNFSSSTSALANDNAGNVSFNFLRTSSSSFCGQSGEAGSLGLIGLQNLGNTCFMNSALQCLVHTPKLVDYFLGDYNREINHDNPLGMNGEIALAFGDLLRMLWAPGASTVAPRMFKLKLARFAPQFSGFNQHDSQELLAFLLDGLHEDLNRVKLKPYVEAKDGEGRADEEVADEYWQNHLARNDSIIVDVCQGQYKSTLVCPVCKKISVMFDPFMYLSLPLPSTTVRTMTLTVVSTDGIALPSPYTVTLSKYGKCEDLIRALGAACSLRDDETLLVAEVYNNRIIRYLEDPADSLSLIRDDDRLVAYRLKKDTNHIPLVVFMHQQMEEQCINGKTTSSWKAFGIPLVAKFSGVANGSDIHSLYLKLLNPYLMPPEDTSTDIETSESTLMEVTGKEDSSSPDNCVEGSVSDMNGLDSLAGVEFKFYLTDDRGTFKDSEIGNDDPVAVKGVLRHLNVLVRWPEKHTEKYDTCLLSSLHEIFKSGSFAKKSQEIASLYKCLQAFLTEEPLGPEDMWYCPGCKEHRQAIKKLDLWRLPEILVIHLKRFSYSRFTKNKLETFVDFPVDNLDLSSYITHKNGQLSTRYTLYAISNHYGGMGGGHYTAYIHHGGDRWYDFDDSDVSPISQDKIKTSAAYVLFYRRVADT